MKPAPFAFTAPQSLEAALSSMRQHGTEAKVLAGGQSLIPLLNFRLARPTVVLDLNRVADLDYVRESPDGGLRIGAMTRQSRLERDPLVAARTPLLKEAIPFIAHPQIRNRGTAGGSLAHADPAAELPAVAVALGARFRLQSETGERWVAARDFFVGLLTTKLEPEELLVEIEFPAQPAGAGWSFMEIARRYGDYAMAGVAAMVEVDEDDVCRDATLVYMSAGDGPVSADSAAEMLRNEQLDDAIFEATARRASEKEIEPTSDIHSTAEFKRHLCYVLTRRALATATERAVQEGRA